jgi:general secretion pathway protein K
VRDRRGFVLVAALWLLVALSAVGLDFSLHARGARLSAANSIDDSRARAAAWAGVAHVRAQLADRLLVRAADGRTPAEARPLDPWVPLDRFGPRDSIVLGDTRYAVRLRDAGAALNVNRAGEDELRRLFVALRIDAGDADRLAQAIADWRDADDLRRGRGAERADYVRADLPGVPRNGDLRELAELLDVSGMTPALFQRLRPYLTVVGSGQVNLNAADLPVLLALPGMTPEAAGVVLRARRSGRALSTVHELSLQLSPPARAALDAELARLLMRATFETREVEIISSGWMAGSPLRSHVEALLVRGGDHAFLVWSRVR